MGRRKIEIKAIKDDRNRSVTFLKRKGGLFKKAHELSVLTSVDVAVIIFGQNNKLYEYSSSNLSDFLQRYQYARTAYGGPHELKGPDDFKDKKDGDDDDDDDDLVDPRNDSHSPPHQAMMPHALQNQPQFQAIGTPSASPPMPNGAFHHVAHHAQHTTSQPLSRPGSRANIRHPSHNPPVSMPPMMSQPPQQQPNYAYQPNPPIYNPQAAAALGSRSQPPPPYHQYTSVPPGHAHPPPQPQPHQTPPQQHHMYPQEPSRPMPTSQIPPPPPAQQQRPAQPPVSQAPSQQPPPTIVHEDKTPLTVPSPEQQPSQFNSPPMPQPKPLPASRSHSIFTPIDDSRSLLMKHWTTIDSDVPIKSEMSRLGDAQRSQSLDVNALKRNSNTLVNGVPKPPSIIGPTSIPPIPLRTASTPSAVTAPPMPPSRTNSLASDPKRPRLKVQIPSDHSDDEKPTGNTAPETGSSSGSHRNNNPSNKLLTPIREPGQPGPVLPPPSPSASALLSAGATGPPNPFARPLPPNTNGVSNGPGGQRDIDTPISALPSRFMSDNLLPSPSSFYNEWGFGREGSSATGNMLPSPLNFQTPINPHGPSFRDEVVENGKRKLGEEENAQGGKRVKA